MGDDIREAPNCFLSATDTYQQVIIKLANHISHLGRQATSARNAALRAQKMRVRKARHAARSERQLKRKVKNLFSADEPQMVQKMEAQK